MLYFTLITIIIILSYLIFCHYKINNSYIVNKCGDKIDINGYDFYDVINSKDSEITIERDDENAIFQDVKGSVIKIGNIKNAKFE